MIEVLKSVDVWFLLLSVMVLGGWFVWSIRKLFCNLEASITALRDLIEKLFDKNDDHESRLSVLEGRCQAMACEVPAHGAHGRRDRHGA